MATPPAAPLLGMYNLGGSFPTPGPSAWNSGPTTNIANQYFAMVPPWSDFGPGFISQCNSNGLIPFIELEGWDYSQAPILVSDITAGAYDTYLTDIGTSIAAGGQKCILTWNHEMNVSGQYPWSYNMTGSGPGGGNLTPAEWITGWKYVHDKVNSTAGGLALWMWACSADTGGTSTTSPSPWWPGSSWVDMVGIDGYEALEGSPVTFAGVFAAALSDIRALGWSGDIWCSETNLALMEAGGGDSIEAFVADMHAAGMTGILEFEDSGLNVMTSAQWTRYNAAVAAAFGGGTVTSTGSASMARVRAGGQSGPITSTGSASLAVMRAGSPVPLVRQPVPAVPRVPAGWRPGKADFDLWVTRPFSFLAQAAYFAAQLTGGQGLTGGNLNIVHFDTVTEDPYGGWSATATGSQAAWSWLCPPGCAGWYEVTLRAFTGNQASTTAQVVPALALNGSLWQYGGGGWAASGGDSGAPGSVQVPLSPGDYVSALILPSVTTTAPTTAGQLASMELAWVSS